MLADEVMGINGFAVIVCKPWGGAAGVGERAWRCGERISNLCS